MFYLIKENDISTDKKRDRRWSKKCEKLLNSKVINLLHIEIGALQKVVMVISFVLHYFHFCNVISMSGLFYLQEDFVNPLVDLFVQKMEEMCELSSKLQAA